MTAPVRDLSSCEPVSAVSAGKSPGKVNGKHAKLNYRQFFAARWGAFIRANFDSPEHAAHVFGVDGSTSRKWWQDDHAPSGFVVGLAYDEYPDEAAIHLRRAR
jgi:hypothetical protein